MQGDSAKQIIKSSMLQHLNANVKLKTWISSFIKTYKVFEICPNPCERHHKVTLNDAEPLVMPFPLKNNPKPWFAVLTLPLKHNQPTP